MSKHTARVTWERGDQAFTDNRYSRVHAWRFDGGAEVLADLMGLCGDRLVQLGG